MGNNNSNLSAGQKVLQVIIKTKEFKGLTKIEQQEIRKMLEESFTFEELVDPLANAIKEYRSYAQKNNLSIKELQKLENNVRDIIQKTEAAKNEGTDTISGYFNNVLVQNLEEIQRTLSLIEKVEQELRVLMNFMNYKQMNNNTKLPPLE